jgi:hypothetical protein
MYKYYNFNILLVAIVINLSFLNILFPKKYKVCLEFVMVSHNAFIVVF